MGVIEGTYITLTNYTKKKIISSMYNNNERWSFIYKLFQNMNIIQIF